MLLLLSLLPETWKLGEPKRDKNKAIINAFPDNYSFGVAMCRAHVNMWTKKAARRELQRCNCIAK